MIVGSKVLIIIMHSGSGSGSVQRSPVQRATSAVVAVAVAAGESTHGAVPMVAPVRHGLPAARTLPAQHESPPPGRLLQPLPPHVPQGAAQHTSALSFAPRTPPAAAQSSCGGVGGAQHLRTWVVSETCVRARGSRGAGDCSVLARSHRHVDALHCGRAAFRRRLWRHHGLCDGAAATRLLQLIECRGDLGQ